MPARAKALPTFQLVTQPTATNLGEILWRIGAPVMALLVTLLSSIGFHYFETVNQSLQLQAGEVRRYRIAMGSDGLRLHAAPTLN